MRIGIIGAAGTGKSTLAKQLANHLGSTLVPDHVVTVLRELGRDSWKGVSDVKQRRKVREDALKRKVRAEAEHERFVSDKTVVDYLAYWLQNQSEHEEKHVNTAFVDQCKAAVGRYDLFVFLPLRTDVEYAVGRSQDPVHNLKVAAHKRGLLALWKLPLVEAEYTFGEDMAAWCARVLPRPATSA
ncbi:MAG: ATP-binding protein [Deltaproteobacteria bacterium]|jgi:nicotinamide riboside kinase|nr:ATP-binding protein [Deltaproteobacteria bacterium]